MSATLHGKPIELHLSEPRISVGAGFSQPLGGPAEAGRHIESSAALPAPLVLYVSGDGGWFGAAVDMFHVIADSGYYAVGFSAKAFLKLERPDGRLANPEQLASEYDEILTTSRAALHLPADTPVVLSGWSRGAAFAVLVSTAHNAPRPLQGVVAIGMTEDDDLQASETGDDDETVAPGVPRHVGFEPYARLARLGSVRCAVIQSSGDHFLPAARARELFGPDTLVRRLYAITARNHRFSGGKDAFDHALVDALHWIGEAAPR